MSQVTAEATIQVNGRSQPLAARTIAALLEERGVETGGRGVAVALNGSVVPRTAWAETRLSPGDTVEVVQAKQGG